LSTIVNLPVGGLFRSALRLRSCTSAAAPSVAAPSATAHAGMRPPRVGALRLSRFIIDFLRIGRLVARRERVLLRRKAHALAAS
jgi:hypothetical protein